jgi:hypothetical protein
LEKQGPCGANVSPYLKLESLPFLERLARLAVHKEKAMRMKVIVSALLISAATVAAVTPANANWFPNKYLGISRNVGSAPNPTPDDVRQMRLPIVVERDNNRPGLFARIGAMLRGERAEQQQASNTGR